MIPAKSSIEPAEAIELGDHESIRTTLTKHFERDTNARTLQILGGVPGVLDHVHELPAPALAFRQNRRALSREPRPASFLLLGAHANVGNDSLGLDDRLNLRIRFSESSHSMHYSIYLLLYTARGFVLHPHAAPARPGGSRLAVGCRRHGSLRIEDWRTGPWSRNPARARVLLLDQTSWTCPAALGLRGIDSIHQI